MKYDPQKHHRASTRLKGQDYSLAGAYFITLVAYQREMLFGKIVDGEVKLNQRGEIVQEEWFASTKIRKEIRLFPDEFVVMPNYIHGIVWIVEDVNNVGATGRSSDQHVVGADLVKQASGSTITTTASSVTNANWMPFGDILKQTRVIGRRTKRISFWGNKDVEI